MISIAVVTAFEVTCWLIYSLLINLSKLIPEPGIWSKNEVAAEQIRWDRRNPYHKVACLFVNFGIAIKCLVYYGIRLGLMLILTKKQLIVEGINSNTFLPIHTAKNILFSTEYRRAIRAFLGLAESTSGVSTSTGPAQPTQTPMPSQAARYETWSCNFELTKLLILIA